MKHKTDWNKTLTNPDDYESSWEWAMSNSEYHFDNSIQDQDGDWLTTLGRFENPAQWQAERDKLVHAGKSIIWKTRKYFGDEEKESPMLKQEEYDIEQGGGDPSELELTNMVDNFNDYPILQKMVDYFDLEGVDKKKKYRAHVQMTGQMFNLHIDKLWEWNLEDPESVCRIGIFLDDWQPGQFLMYGNLMYQWKAGDAFVFDWANTPHATANASNHPRPMLLLTGIKTDRTREIIANASKNNRFTID